MRDGFRYVLIVLMLPICGTLWFFLAMTEGADKGPARPAFLRAPHLLTEYDEIWVEVQIVPREDIRAVVLEAWEASEWYPFDDPDFAVVLQPDTLIRSSIEPVNEGNRAQRTFPFRWRQSLKPGLYVLIARITVSRGLTYASKPYRLQVV